MNLLLSQYHLSFFVIHLGYARNLYALTVGVLFQIISGFTGPSLPGNNSLTFANFQIMRLTELFFRLTISLMPVLDPLQAFDFNCKAWF